MNIDIYDVNFVIGKPGYKVSGAEDVSEISEHMDKNNIKKGLVYSLSGLLHDSEIGNKKLYDSFERCKIKKLMPVPVFNLNYPPDIKEMDKWKSLGTKGVMFCPSFYKHRMNEDNSVFGYILENNQNILMPLAPFYGSNIKCSDADLVIEAAKYQKDIKVTVLNASRGHMPWLLKAMARYENIYADIGNMSTGRGIENFTEAGFSKRLFCGSGFGISYITVNMYNVLTSDITDYDKKAILFENANRIFG